MALAALGTSCIQRASPPNSNSPVVNYLWTRLPSGGLVTMAYNADFRRVVKES